MPLYHFSTVHGDKVFDHGDALDLKNDDAAWEEATIACGEILKGLDGSLVPNREWRMEVKDDSGASVCSLRLLSERHR